MFPQRKETLLVEYKQRGKVNRFLDRRIGEGDSEMSAEDKMLKRFTLERAVSRFLCLVSERQHQFFFYICHQEILIQASVLTKLYVRRN